MERLQLTPEQQAYAQANYVGTPGEPTEHREGVNTVVDDNVLVNGTEGCVVLGASVASEGCVDCYFPTWGDFVLPIWNLADYVSDRAGPNGETMPIFDPPEEELP